MRRWLLLLPALLTGCSALTYDQAACTAASDCREAFGLGWSCAESGFCEAAAPNPRCSSTPDDILTSPADHADRILLGSIFDRVDFTLMVKSARLAILQVNVEDGLAGQEFGIIECSNAESAGDDGLDPEQATAALGEELIESWGVHALVGPATSGRASAAYNAWSPLGAVTISPSATSPALTSIDGTTSTDSEPGLFWRTAPPDSLQGRVIAREMLALSHDNVAVIAQLGAYGQGLAEVFDQQFAAEGGSVTLLPFEESSDLAQAVVTASAADFDAVLVISSQTGDVVGFFNAIPVANLTDAYTAKTIFLPDGAFDAQLIEDTSAAARPLFDNVRGTVPRTPSGGAFKAFAAFYGLEYNGEDPSDFGFSAHAFDAAWLAIAGTAWSLHQEGRITGLGTARGLRQLSDPDYEDPDTGEALPLGPTSWNDIATNFAEGNAVDIVGASGSLDYDPISGETAAPINVWTIANGDFVTQYCVDLSPSPSPDCCTDPVTDACN